MKATLAGRAAVAGWCLWLALTPAEASAPVKDGTHRATVAPGKIVEACRVVETGDKLAFSYEASGPLDFNVHFHRGKDVHTLVKTDDAPKYAASFVSAAREDYCLMWTNKGKQPVALTYSVSTPK